jgi:hypothetical protein
VAQYSIGYVTFEAPNIDCNWQKEQLLCIWYPVTVQWYRLLSLLPRFYFYQYTLGADFSWDNFGLWPTTNYIDPAAPWVYGQSLFLMVVPALMLAASGIVFGVLFYLACSVTCCCQCCCCVRLVPNTERGALIRLIARILMIVLCAFLCFGIVLQFGGYSYFRVAINTLFDIVIAEVKRLADTADTIQDAVLSINTTLIGVDIPTEIDLAASIFDPVLVILEEAREIALCSRQIPNYVQWVLGNPTTDQAYNSTYLFFQRNYGCPDVLGFGAIFMINLLAMICIVLGLLAVVCGRSFPSLLMSWLIFFCVTISMLVVFTTFPTAVFLSDVCTQISKLEEGDGDSEFLNTYNAPQWIVECKINELIEPINAFLTEANAKATEQLDNLEAIAANLTLSQSDRDVAKQTIALFSSSLAAFTTIQAAVLDYISCDHMKDFYYAVKNLICQTILSANTTVSMGAAISGIVLVPGFFITMFAFVILRSQPNKSSEQLEAELEAAQEEEANDNMTDTSEDSEEEEEEDVMASSKSTKSAAVKRSRRRKQRTKNPLASMDGEEMDEVVEEESD